MKKYLRLFRFVTVLAVMAGLLLSGAPATRVQAAPEVSTSVIISQVYGGGGGASGTYKYDYVELYNLSSAPVDISGYSLQYGSAAGVLGGSTGTNIYTIPATTTINAGKYLLIQLGTAGTGGVDFPVTPDLTGGLNLSGASGKMALASSNTWLNCLSATACVGKPIIDLVAYGATTNAGEGDTSVNNNTALAGATYGAVRKGSGCTDSDNNNLDFDVVQNPVPRNSSTTAYTCPTSTPPTGVGLATPASGIASDTTLLTVAVTKGIIPDSTGLTVTGDLSALNGPSSQSFYDDGTHGDAASGDLTFSITTTVGLTVTPGLKVIPTTIQDAQLRSGSAPISYRVVEPCTAAFTPIYSLQGSGDASPLLGVQSTEGIVTADFNDSSTQKVGFFIQDATGDGNPATSDGILVYDLSNSLSGSIAVGDEVHIRGTVKEFNTLTEMDTLVSLAICSNGNTVTPTNVTFPLPVGATLEPYEGMLVSIDETMTVEQNYFQGRYGQITLGFGGRLFNSTNGNGATADENTRRMLVLDDGNSNQNPNPIPYLIDDSGPQPVRAGDTVRGLAGVLDYGPINSNTSIRFYRMHPTAAPLFTRSNPRTAAPDAVGGTLRVTSFNVLNYFNGDGLGGGFPTSRGANTLVEFTRQRDKIINAICALNPDVSGLMEIERDGYATTSAIQDLVNGLNAVTGCGPYAFAAPTTDPGDDEITDAIIYKTSAVDLVDGSAQFFQVTTDPSYNPLFDRPPLAATFVQKTNSQKFSVIVNHFKSKGCSSDNSETGGDVNGIYGCWNAKRVAQATEMLNIVNSVKTSSGDPRVFVIGDLNAYGAEPPITTLTDGGLVNEALKVPADQRYSYVFDGTSGYLDQALTTEAVDSHVKGVTFWHINADEASVIDYNTEFKPQDLYTPGPYRASDHDPVLIGLDLTGPNFTNYLPATMINSSMTQGATIGASSVASAQPWPPMAYISHLLAGLIGLAILLRKTII